MRKLSALFAKLLISTAATAAFAVAPGCGKKDAPPAATEGSEEAPTPAEGDENPTPKKVKEEAAKTPPDTADGDAPRTRHGLRDRTAKRPGPIRPRGPAGETGDGPVRDPATVGDPTEPKIDPASPAGEPPKTDPGAPPVVADAPKTDPTTPPVVGDAPKTDPATPEPPAPVGDAPKVDGVAGSAHKPDLHNAAGGVDAALILPLATVLEVTSAKGLEYLGILPGIAPAMGYGSTFYAAPGAGHFGVALQVWQDVSRRESDDRYRRMRLQYPNAEDITVLQPLRAYYSYFQGIQSIIFADPSRRMIIAIGCGEGVCNQDQLVKLAKAARDRL